MTFVREAGAIAKSVQFTSTSSPRTPSFAAVADWPFASLRSQDQLPEAKGPLTEANRQVSRLNTRGCQVSTGCVANGCSRSLSTARHVSRFALRPLNGRSRRMSCRDLLILGWPLAAADADGADDLPVAPQGGPPPAKNHDPPMIGSSGFRIETAGPAGCFSEEGAGRSEKMSNAGAP